MFAKCKDLIAYTLQITNNTNRFPKKIRFTITNRLQDMALLMYENLLMANEIFPVDQEDIRERKQYQRKALVISKQLLFLIELSLAQERIEPGSASYWAGLVEEVQKLTGKWMVSDSRRFQDI